MDYLNFELEITAGNGGAYPITVIASPAGEAHDTMHMPFDGPALHAQLATLQNALLNSSGPTAQPSSQMLAVQSFGQALFTALFTGAVHNLYVASRSQARAQGNGLRIMLRIQAPELAALPWEYLYDPDEGRYLCLSDVTQVVRYFELPEPFAPLSVTQPLSILGVTASPTNLPQLDIENEKKRIETALADLQAKGLVKLTWLAGRTWEDVQQAMLGGPWHIFHFTGHGGFDADAGEGLIVLEDNASQAHYLDASQVAMLLSDHAPLRLVILNSCDGAQAMKIDIFSSTAATLVRRGIPAVLANQYEITDQAAIELARAFYEALTGAMPVDMAVGEARKAILLSADYTVEWGVPVLSMHTPDGILFDMQSSSATSSSTPVVVAPATPPTQPLSTPLGAKDPYSSFNGKLAFYDPLSQPYQWDVYVNDASGSCQFNNGAYHVQAKGPGGYYCSDQILFSNFTFEVQITILHGDYGGIVFRQDSTGNNFYYFEVCINGSYGLYLYAAKQAPKMLVNNTSAAITTGLNQPNTIAVVVNGNTFDLYVNHQKIDSVADSAYTSPGFIGLMADSGNNPTEVAFRDARVWTW